MSPKSRALRIGLEVLLWAVCLRLVMVFARAGWAALLLLWPRAAAYGAAIISVVMLGGMGTHVLVEHRPSRVTSEFVHLVVASIVLAGRWQIRIKH